MNSPRDRKNVRLDDINIDLNGPFTTSYGFTIAKLLFSICKIGIVNPPLLLATEHNGFEIVSGLRRILACSVLGITEIPAYVVKDKNRKELFLHTLFENYAGRSFNQVELAMAIVRIDQFFDKNDALKLLPFLGVKASQDTIELCWWIVEKIPDDFKILIAQGRISQKFLSNLKQLTEGDYLALMELCIMLQLGQNYQNEVFSILRDLSLLRNQQMKELLKEFGVWEILSKNITLQQKTKLMIERLREERSPRIKKTVEQVYELRKALDLENAICLDINPSFEEDFFVLKLCFKDGADLKSKLHKLIQNHPLLNMPEPTALLLNWIRLEDSSKK